MCVEASYYRMSRSEQAEERARVQKHHIQLREDIQLGVPGAQEAYDKHLDQHRRGYSDHTFREADERAKSILAQREAEDGVAFRKAARRLELEPSPELRRYNREQRIRRRAARRAFTIDTPTANSAQEFLDRQEIKTLERVLIPA